MILPSFGGTVLFIYLKEVFCTSEIITIPVIHFLFTVCNLILKFGFLTCLEEAVQSIYFKLTVHAFFPIAFILS